MKYVKSSLRILLLLLVVMSFTGCAQLNNKNAKRAAKTYIQNKYGIEANPSNVEFVSGIYYVTMMDGDKEFSVQVMADDESKIKVENCMDDYEHDKISSEIEAFIIDKMGNKDIKIYSEYSIMGYNPNILDESIRSFDDIASRDNMFFECIILGHGVTEEQVNKIKDNMFNKSFKIGVYEWDSDTFPENIGELRKHDEIYAGYIPEFSPVIINVKEEYAISDSEATLHNTYDKFDMGDFVFVASHDAEMEVNQTDPTKSLDPSMAGNYNEVSDWYEVKVSGQKWIRVFIKTNKDLEKLSILTLNDGTYIGEVSSIEDTTYKTDYNGLYENYFEGTSWIKLGERK